MATSDNSKMDDTKATKPDTSPPAIHNFLCLIRELATAEDYREVVAISEENSQLKTTNENYATTIDVLQDKHSRMLTTKSELESTIKERGEQLDEMADAQKKLEDEVAKLNEQLQDQANEIEATNKEITTLVKSNKALEVMTQTLKEELKTRDSDLKASRLEVKELKKELEETQKERDNKGAKLKVLQSFAKEMHGEAPESYVKILAEIASLAYDMAEKVSVMTIEERILADPSKWESLREHPAVRGAIPIPASNSCAAKDMRLAAVLAVFSASLREHMLLPSYFVREDHKLVPLLSALAYQNPPNEVYCRAVLLSILPETQEKFAGERVESIVNDVLKCVGPLLPTPLLQEEFNALLHSTCMEICKRWTYLQRVRDKIEPYWKPRHIEEWEKLPLPSLENGAGNQQSNGTPSSNSDSQHQPQAQSDLTEDDVQAVLWPCMRVVGKGEMETVVEGFVLSKTQVQAAVEEERAKRAAELEIRGRPMTTSPVGIKHRTKNARTLSKSLHNAVGKSAQKSL